MNAKQLEEQQAKTKPRYWHCIIGPIEDGKIPFGGDGPPRFAVKAAVASSCGEHAQHCWSGWIDEDEKEVLQRASMDLFKKNHNIKE